MRLHSLTRISAELTANREARQAAEKVNEIEGNRSSGSASTQCEHCGSRNCVKNPNFAAEKIRAASQGAGFELLAISGLGRIRVAIIHPGEQPIQRRNLLKQLLVPCALKLQRQLIYAPLDLCTRELFWQYKLDRHPRCISQHRTKRQEQFSILQS